MDGAALARGPLGPAPSPANSSSALLGTTAQQEPEAGLCLAARDQW